jgi:dihydrofolate reductase
MRIKARMGISADGYVSNVDGVPTLALSESFVPAASHGYPEFIAGVDAVVMGRSTFLPALGAPQWPWGDLQVYVLTSSALPTETPEHVVTSPEATSLIDRLHDRGSGGDAHLVGGPQTIRAFQDAGALDVLELVILPIVLGRGLPLWDGTNAPSSFRLQNPPRSFEDGSVEISYSTRF